MIFNELLHAIEVDSGEEPALCIQVGEGTWPPSTMEKRRQKFASTLIEVDAPGRTALVPMSAPSAAVEHTQLHNAHSAIPP